jgi:hypothetical protein
LWSIADVPDNSRLSLQELFREAKRYFDQLLQPIDSSYECNAFRAGAWAIQPETEVLKSLANIGFTLDSSVVPGMRKNNEYVEIDYTDAEWDSDLWKVSTSVTREDPEGDLLELPIASQSIRGFRRLLQENIPQRILGHGHPEGCEGNSSSANQQSYLKQLIARKTHAVDFCHYYANSLLNYVNDQQNKGRKILNLIGHTKDFSMPDHFQKFLKKAKESGHTFPAIQEVAEL